MHPDFRTPPHLACSINNLTLLLSTACPNTAKMPLQKHQRRDAVDRVSCSLFREGKAGHQPSSKRQKSPYANVDDEVTVSQERREESLETRHEDGVNLWMRYPIIYSSAIKIEVMSRIMFLPSFHTRLPLPPIASFEQTVSVSRYAHARSFVIELYSQVVWAWFWLLPL